MIQDCETNLTMVNLILKKIEYYSLNEVMQGAFKHSNNILLIATNIINLIKENYDSEILLILVRALADRISTFMLIYDTDVNERILRHYLFVKNGCSQQIEILGNKVSKLNVEQSTDIRKDFLEKIEQCERIKSYCDNMLLSFKPYFEDRVFKKICDKSEWNYDSLTFKKQSWGELHGKFFPDNKDFFQEYLSQIVHGLHVPYLKITNDDNTKHLTLQIVNLMIIKFCNSFIKVFSI